MLSRLHADVIWNDLIVKGSGTPTTFPDIISCSLCIISESQQSICWYCDIYSTSLLTKTHVMIVTVRPPPHTLSLYFH